MTNRAGNKQKVSGHRGLLALFCCLLGAGLLAGTQMPAGQTQMVEGEKKPMKVTLLHADRTVQRSSNKNLQMLIGNVEFLYDSIYMSCDTAYNYNDRNYFEAFGNVFEDKKEEYKVTTKEVINSTIKFIAHLYF